MDLPQELIDRICSYLLPEDLKSAYYVSVNFRQAAEENAGRFRTLEVEITDENKDEFLKRYCGFRLRYLRNVQFHVEFPIIEANEDSEEDSDEDSDESSDGDSDKDSEEDTSCRESIEEICERDRNFTNQVRGLFKILKQVEDTAGMRNRGIYELILQSPEHARDENVCFHRQHDYWRVHLLKPESLPELMSVSSFRLLPKYSGEVEPKLDYRILIDCLSRLPNAEKVTWYTGHGEWTPGYSEAPANKVPWDYDGPRRDTRHDFGKAAILAAVPDTLRTVQLSFMGDLRERPSEVIDHSETMPDLVAPASRDPLSTGLRILSYHLRTLTLRVQADESLFWPDDGSHPTWPNLTFLSIMFHVATPSGSWYFNGPRGEGHVARGREIQEHDYPPYEVTEDDDNQHDEFEKNPRAFEKKDEFQFRVSPNNEKLEPFLESFARAASNMPKLRRASLWSPLRWVVDGRGSEPDRLGYEDFEYFDDTELSADYSDLPRDLVWGVAYSMPNFAAALRVNPGEVNCEVRQIWWAVRKWRPNPRLHALMQNIGGRKHGDALKEYWDDESAGRTTRKSFEDWTLFI